MPEWSGMVTYVCCTCIGSTVKYVLYTCIHVQVLATVSHTYMYNVCYAYTMCMYMYMYIYMYVYNQLDQ